MTQGNICPLGGLQDVDIPSLLNSCLLSTSPSVGSTDPLIFSTRWSLSFPQNRLHPWNEVLAPLSVVQILPPLASAGCGQSQSVLAPADSAERRERASSGPMRSGSRAGIFQLLFVFSNRTVSGLSLSLPEDKHISPL